MVNQLRWSNPRVAQEPIVGCQLALAFAQLVYNYALIVAHRFRKCCIPGFQSFVAKRMAIALAIGQHGLEIGNTFAPKD